MASVLERLSLRLSNLLLSPGTLFLLLILISARVFGAGATLAWDPVNSPSVAGYKVYYGWTAGNYTSSIDVGNTTSYVVSNLAEGATYHFAATAYDAARTESGFSNDASATIPYSAPVAQFSASTTSGTAPLAMNFTNTSKGTITTYAWGFGDGTTSSAQNPSHVYSSAGVYTVGLAVTGPGGGNTRTNSNYITVSAPSLVPVAGMSASTTSGTPPLTVNFTSTSTGSITTYAWDFGDGGTSNAQNPSHVYAAAGVYTVSLTVTGSGGSNTKTNSNYITVSAPPTAPGNLTATALSASQINLSWTAATDDVGVTGYLVERCQGVGCTAFAQLATATGTSFADGGRVAGTSYSYRVRATDATTNLGPYSNTASATTLAATPVATGLVAAYSFDEGAGTTIADLSGNGNNGALVNGPTWTAGRYGGALTFDGASYVNLGNNPSLQLTGSMTLTAWIRISANPLDDGAIAGKLGGAGWQLKTSPDTGLRTAAIQISSDGGDAIQRYSASVLTIGTWRHVAGVYNAAARSLDIYVNGVLDNGLLSGTIPAAQYNAPDAVNIGQRTGFPGAFNFQGTIDQVRIYNRALSQAEIQSDMVTPVGTTTLSNAPPTVTTPASASPNPAPGLTTTLSVLGADDGGEANLTYTWATTGTPPAPVTFSANGTNAAKTVGATFSKAGSYSVQVTIRDAGNLTATSSVTVTVTPTLTRITVSPASASVATGGTQAFTATALDQFGVALSPQPAVTWTVSGGGTISATGLFTAGSTAGGPYTVMASSGGITGTASVTVSAPPTVATPTVATPASASPNPAPGLTTTLSVLGADGGGEANLTYTWANNSKHRTRVTFSANGTNAAKTVAAKFARAGIYSLKVTIKNQAKLTVTSSVTVTVQGITQ